MRCAGNMMKWRGKYSTQTRVSTDLLFCGGFVLSFCSNCFLKFVQIMLSLFMTDFVPILERQKQILLLLTRHGRLSVTEIDVGDRFEYRPEIHSSIEETGPPRDCRLARIPLTGWSQYASCYPTNGVWIRCSSKTFARNQNL